MRIFGQVGDHFYQFYPSSSQASAAAVKSGMIHFPDEKSKLYFDGFGADHLKAMLFDSAAGAQAVLDAMQSSDGKARDLILARSIDKPAFTSRLSVAVGAFLMGIIVSESECSRTVITKVEPMKELFIATFFISIGYQFNPALFMQGAAIALVIAIIFILAKMSSVSFACFMANYKARSSLLIGASLARNAIENCCRTSPSSYAMTCPGFV